MPKQDEVREQLDRILASRFFRNSQRYRDFLRYTVERALNGNTADIKERTLGMEVFARNLDYDTSIDPVVRVTAAEVRKRLAQYYQIPGHENEPRIEFPRGSYVPLFEPPTGVPDSGQVTPVTQVEVLPRRTETRWQLALAIVISCILVSAFVWSKLPGRENSFDRFWSPIKSSSAPVMICIPDMNFNREPNSNPVLPAPISEAPVPPLSNRNQIRFPDALALSTVSSILGRQHAFFIRRVDDVQLQDLQESSAIIIGDRANSWATRLRYNLRFSFAHEGNLRYISDSQNPSSREWSIPDTAQDPTAKISKDFGIISRVLDRTSGHPIVMSSGITGYATGPAAQCLADSACLGQAEKLSPGDWKHKNIQIVIETVIVGNNAGQPSVVAAYLW